MPRHQVQGETGNESSDRNGFNQNGIDAFFPILRGITTLADAMKPENAKYNMAGASEQVYRLWAVK